MDIFSSIEYHVLHPQIRDVEIEAATRQSAERQMAGICVPPYWVKKASRDTRPANIPLLTPVGFPYGYQRTEAKVAEMDLAFADGAQALELVINLSALKSQRWNWIKAEIARFAKALHDREQLLTVVTDVDLLSEEELIRLCKDAADAGADFFKTATGAFTEAKPTNTRFVRQVLHPSVGLKVFKNQATTFQIRALLEEGADIVCIGDLSSLDANV